jgi:hypothetical protein
VTDNPDAVEAARTAAKSLCVMAAIVAAVAIIIFTLDLQLKQRILAQALEARDLLDRAEGIVNGTQTVNSGNPDLGGGQPGDGGGGGVHADEPGGTPADTVLNGRVVRSGGRPPGMAAGSGGDSGGSGDAS